MLCFTLLQSVLAWQWRLLRHNLGLSCREVDLPLTTWEKNMQQLDGLKRNCKVAGAAALLAVAALANAGAAEGFLRCNGTSTRLVTGKKITIPESVTLEAWIRADTQPAADKYYGLAGEGYLQGSATGFGLLANYNGNLGFQVRNKDTTIASATAGYNFDGAWHHLAGVRDAASETIIFYLDGVEVARNVSTQQIASITHNFSIGAVATTGSSHTHFFKGDITEVRLWGAVRTPEEIAAQMHYRLKGDEENLLGYWRVAGDALDLAAGNNGTMTGASWQSDANLTFEDSLLIAGVPAPHGTPDPPYGTVRGLSAGETLLCAAPTGEVNEPGTKAWCAGYQLYTNETLLAASGSATSLLYQHDKHATLNWLWQRQFEVEIEATSGGSVSSSGGWYAEGELVSVTATPAGGSAFLRWSGDVPATQRWDPTLTLPVTGPLQVTAEFSDAVYYVTPTGSDSASGLSWSAAKATIQGAIDAADDGAVVVVSCPAAHC